MVQSKYEAERLVGILLRKIVGDIVRDFHKNTLSKLYKTNNQINEISKHCMEWNDEIARFFSDDNPEEQRKKELYTNLLIIYEDEGIDPDTDDLWRMLMKKDLPQLFYKRFEAFGQVPQVASLDVSEPPAPDKHVKDISDVNW